MKRVLAIAGARMHSVARIRGAMQMEFLLQRNCDSRCIVMVREQ
jgi:hypothetical protein